MNDLERSAKDMMSDADIDKIKQIASTAEAAKIQQMMNASDMREAAARGDMESIKNAVSQLLKTDAGARLANRISEMMNNR